VLIELQVESKVQYFRQGFAITSCHYFFLYVGFVGFFLDLRIIKPGFFQL